MSTRRPGTGVGGTGGGVGMALAVAFAVAAGASGAVPTGVAAQDVVTEPGSRQARDRSDGAASAAFEDSTARALWTAAVDHRLRLDDALVSYTAVVRQRVSAGIRMPLKDRTLYRSESAHRVFWDRDGDVIVQVLALREQTPLGVQEGATKLGLFDQNFDPLDDRLFFGMVPPDDEAWEEDPDDFWFEHPLEPVYRDHYRFATGDTLTLDLGAGRVVRAVELRVAPTEADVHRMTGSLWIEPESGALVRAVYRLADAFDALRDIPDLREEEDKGEFRMVPPFLKPWGAEIEVIAVEYALWDDVWLPRTMRAEGVATAGIVTAPAAVEITYDVESVVTEADLDAGEGADAFVEEEVYETREEAMAALARRTTGDEPYVMEGGFSRRDRGDDRVQRVRYLVPVDPAYLRESPDLPPPIWEAAPGFPDADDRAGYVDMLESLPTPPVVGLPWTFRWGPQRPDLLRYNRVEGLSVGARGQIRPQTPLGPLSVTATVRAGTNRREPSARLDVTDEGLRRRVTVSGYHELAAVDEDARSFGPGNSLSAFLFGVDGGEYFVRTGAQVSLTPPTADRQSYDVALFAEYHDGPTSVTDVSLPGLTGDWEGFRSNLAIEEGWDVGGRLRWRPWWGTDPRMVQGGLEAEVLGGGRDFRYLRTSLGATLVVPLGADFRAAVRGDAGRSWGDPPRQRYWYLGGPQSVRGYRPSRLTGPAFFVGSGELGRQFAFGTLTIFAETGWAGEIEFYDPGELLWSVGTGASLVDGLIRVDAAYGLRAPGGFRLHFYLDGAL